MKMRNRRENGGRQSVAIFGKTSWGAAILTVATFLTAASGLARTASADEPTVDADWRPVAVVASAGYDSVWTAVERVAKEMKLAEAVEAARAIYGDVQGVDREKPFGLVVATDGSEVVPFAFLPVASVEKLEFVGASDLKEKIETTPEGTFFGDEPRFRLLEKDGWLFVCEAGKEASVPTAEPTAWLEGDAGVLTFQADLTALPEELLESAFAALRQKAAENAPTDEDALEQFDATLEYYSAIFDSLEQIRWTLNVDAATGDLGWNCAVVCKDGSPLAETFAEAKKAETRWGAIAETPNAVFAAAQAGKRSALDREFLAKQQAVAFDNVKTALEIGFDSDEERAFAEELFAVLEKCAKSTNVDGTFDSASAFVCEPNVLASLAVAPVDGSELTGAVRKLVEKMKVDVPEKAEKIDKFVKIGAETVEGFVVSKVDVPFAEFDADWPEPLAAYWSAKTFALRFGTSGDAILIVAGIDSEAADAEFARIAAASKTKTPVPRRAAFALAPLGRWALEALGGTDALTAAARKTFERIGEADDARFEVEYAVDGNRLDARYVVKSGVFRLIGDVARLNLAASLGSGGEGEDVDELFEEE